MRGDDVVFDTNAVIQWMKNPADLASCLAPEVQPFLTLVSLGELRFGMRNSARSDENNARLDRALSDFRVVLPDVRTADFYAGVCLSLRRKGRPIPSNDVWIAALCLQNDLPLLTRDGHFRDVDELHVLMW